MSRKNLHIPGSGNVFPLSRSRLELFLECPRCFYLCCVCGVSRVPSPSFALNAAVDSLLKKEFDQCRRDRRPHDAMTDAGLDAVPFDHQDLEVWRNVRRGIHHLHQETGLDLSGSPDDVWQMRVDRTLIVVDFKAKGRFNASPSTDLFSAAYWRQVAFYRWLMLQDGFVMNKQVALLYANARKDNSSLDGRLEFALHVHLQPADDAWIEPSLHAARACLDSYRTPEPAVDCEWCKYVTARNHAGEISDGERSHTA